MVAGVIPAALDRLTAQGFELDTSTLTRALYAGDASLYRVVPQAVARPGSVEELARLTRAALTERVPITSRGTGTSIAGNAIGPGLVIDCSRLNAIAQLDPVGRAAIVEPGVVGGSLNALAARSGLRFGPDPSTIDRCTVAGMIGNNACGARALGYGRTSDNLLGLEVITGTGERLSLGAGQANSPTLAALHHLVAANLGVIRTEFGRFSRQVSGYALEHLLPENGFNVAAFLAGTEGTLAVTLAARLRLVPLPKLTALVPIGYPDMAAAADDAPVVVGFAPTAVEGLDRRLLQAAGGRLGSGQLPLPDGDGWLLVELADEDAQRLDQRVEALVQAVHGVAGSPITDTQAAARLWRLRADAAGLAAISGSRPSHAGWEDAAVPVAALGDYLRAFERLLAAHGLHGVPYGHFGEGCVHVRIDFALSNPDGVAGYRRFVEAAAELAAGFGGSASGEHGDGRARSELLSRQYSPAALELLAGVKHLFDPDNLLNPGVLVEPRPLDLDLRRPRANASRLPRLSVGFIEDAHRCTGVGKCLTHGGAMCPSYQATGAEQDSTRGRARVLQELIDGDLIAPDWRSPQVAEALELCLSCKACVSDCPTGTDLAALKSQVLEQSFRRRLRPRHHYSLGRLADWAALVTAIPGLPRLANAALGVRPVHRLVAALAGIDARRRLPRFSPRPARRSRTLPAATPATTAGPNPVAIWVDPFTDALDATRVTGLARLLESAGFTAVLIRQRVDTGVALISTGQRARAARALRRVMDVLHPIAAAGIPIVAMEPSELAVLRAEASDLIEDPRLSEVAAGVHTVAELLAQSSWTPPDLSHLTVVAQPHCHHRAVLDWSADAALLARSGARVITADGCCGLAGDFGMTHYEVSVEVAGLHLLPAVDTAGPDAVLLADGYSCRYQLADLRGRSAVTLAELLGARPASGS
jgi:FAD/FMN-containing dehydrogenases